MTSPADPNQPVISTPDEAAAAFAAWFTSAPPEQTGAEVEARLEQLRARQAGQQR